MNFDYDLAPPTHAQRWRGYNPDENALQKARRECQEMIDKAEGMEDYQMLCLAGEKVVYYDFPFALMPGHIYSEAGVDEYKISKSCEYHFDIWMRDPEETYGPVDQDV